ncbi:hypothetical protein JOE61_003575 [Nocardioides salarius]|uniref:DUF1772 domain-containing protein n=1 Tax=Nocardioides salarius TaxID=374513 RepID=A0ABS2MF00_9ACTN|nr:hypothetical protein [Nocardioides salarius]MBM7509761.1 hypothetical protein [Nocardioides salarius]
MSAASAPEVVLALVASAHLGFQATVTVLVYPALAGLADEPSWARAHESHSRRITPLVAVLYPALVLSGAWLVADGPGAAGWTALVGVTVAIGATAVSAAPTHGRLGRDGPTPALVRRLLLADRVRLAGAVVAAVGAVAVAL